MKAFIVILMVAIGALSPGMPASAQGGRLQADGGYRLLQDPAWEAG
jgi:hypothetical protein